MGCDTDYGKVLRCSILGNRATSHAKKAANREVVNLHIEQDGTREENRSGKPLMKCLRTHGSTKVEHQLTQATITYA